MDEIINALRNLKMPGMAHYWATMQETRQAESLSLKDGLQLLIQAELDNRNQSRNTRLIKKARFRYQASIVKLSMIANVAWTSKKFSISPLVTM